MPRNLKILLTMLLAAFVLMQLYRSIENTDSWPFTANRLFSYLPPPHQTRYRAILYRSDAAGPLEVRMGRIFPVEFHKVDRLVKSVYVRGSEDAKSRLSELVLEALNRGSWNQIGRLKTPARDPRIRFEGFKLIAQTIDTKAFRESDELAIVRQEEIYDYRPDRVER